MNEHVMNRYWANVDTNGPISERTPELGQCYLWRGGHGDGRPILYVGGRSVLVPRVVMSDGEPATIPADTVVRHLCNNARCVRREHLAYADRGEHYRWARLKRPQIEEMMALRKAGASYNQLAERFGVNREHASRVIRGLAWKHVQRSEHAT